MLRQELKTLNKLDKLEKRKKQKELLRQAKTQAATSFLGINPASDPYFDLSNSFDLFWVTLGFESEIQLITQEY